MKKVALITLYNPGCTGLRYVAGSIKAAGHEAHIVNFKEMRAQFVSSRNREQIGQLSENRDVIYVISPYPGKVRYLPYPTPITEKEKQLLVKELRDNIKPDLIGFSLYSVTYENTRQLTEYLKSEMPGIPIIWGGLHCIVAPHECIDVADMICTGEGEIPVASLLEKWDEYKREGRLAIPGLWFRTASGEIVKNPDQPLIQDMDSIAFPIYGENEILIDDDAVSDRMNKPGPFLNAHVYTFTERGCPYQCSYCIHSVLKEQGYTQFRRRSVDNVLEEVRDRVERLGMRHLIFHDEIFIINKKWIREFSEKFRKQFHEPHGVTFTGYVHPFTTDPEMLDWMVKAGLSRVGMGIQSGSERVCKDIFNRPFEHDKSIWLADLLGKYDFEIVQYDLLVNNPFETEEDMRQTFELLMQFPTPFFAGLFGIVIYKYSKLASRPLPENQPDAKTNLYWNMLYHLTGLETLSRKSLRVIYENPRYREHPEELEELVAELTEMEENLKQARGEVKRLQTDLCRIQEWIRSMESETYPLKSAVKKKIKRLLYPILNR